MDWFSRSTTAEGLRECTARHWSASVDCFAFYGFYSSFFIFFTFYSLERLLKVQDKFPPRGTLNFNLILTTTVNPFFRTFFFFPVNPGSRPPDEASPAASQEGGALDKVPVHRLQTDRQTLFCVATFYSNISLCFVTQWNTAPTSLNRETVHTLSRGGKDGAAWRSWQTHGAPARFEWLLQWFLLIFLHSLDASRGPVHLYIYPRWPQGELIAGLLKFNHER